MPSENEHSNTLECPLCVEPLEGQEDYIKASCNKCGERRYHVHCVVDLLEKRFKRAGTKASKNMQFYLRQPQAELIKSRCPRSEGEEECAGYIGASELVKPLKLAPAPPAPIAPAPGPRSKPPKPASVGQLPRTGKLHPIGSRSDRASMATVQPPQQPGVLRDRLGRILQPSAALGAKKKKPLVFPDGIRPEELRLCPQFERMGDCDAPGCVFAHSQEELDQREDECRAEQARLKKEARARRAAEEKAAEEAGAAAAAAAAEEATGVGGGLSFPSAASFATPETSSALAWEGVVPWDSAAEGSGGADSLAAGGGSSKDVWGDLVTRAKAGFESVQSIQGGSTQGCHSSAQSGTSTPLFSQEDTAGFYPSTCDSYEYCQAAPFLPPAPSPAPPAQPAALEPAPVPLPAHTDEDYAQGFQAGLAAALVQMGVAAGSAWAGAGPSVDWGALLSDAGRQEAVQGGGTRWGEEQAGEMGWWPPAGGAAAAQAAPQGPTEEQDNLELEDMLALLCH